MIHNCHICYVLLKRDETIIHDCVPALQSQLERQKNELKKLRNQITNLKDENVQISTKAEMSESVKEAKFL